MNDMTLDDLTLTVSRLIPAPRERVFDAWLDPKMMARFMAGKPEMTCPGSRPIPASAAPS